MLLGSRDVSLEKLAIRVLTWLFVGLAALFAVEFAADLLLTGVPLADLSASSGQGQALASTVSRAFNNLTAMVLTFIALAVPITANMYTPRLIEIFVRDRVNMVVLLFFAAMGAHAIFVQSTMFQQWTPPVQYMVLWLGGVVGFAVLIPYYFYVLSFLNPSTIIQRVTELIVEEYDDIVAHERPIRVAQRRLHSRILHLGNVILRAVDRADRDVSLDAIGALERAIMRYDQVKRTAPPEWFEVGSETFVGYSEDAIRFIVRDRIWVEQKCLSQLMMAYTAALAKMQDAVSAISDVNRQIALHAKTRGDEELLRLCVRYMNTFLREAIKKKDVHAIYDVFSQYTLLASDLLRDYPKVVVDIAEHLRYYAGFARFQGMAFVYELAAFDLMSVVRAAFEKKAQTRTELLERFLAFESDKASVRLTKARVVLAAALSSGPFEAEAERVRETLRASPREMLAEAGRSLLGTTDPVFWEVTDRQLNLDYVEPELRPHVARVLDEVTGRAGVTPDAK